MNASCIAPHTTLSLPDSSLKSLSHLLYNFSRPFLTWRRREREGGRERERGREEEREREGGRKREREREGGREREREREGEREGGRREGERERDEKGIEKQAHFVHVLHVLNSITTPSGTLE